MATYVMLNIVVVFAVVAGLVAVRRYRWNKAMTATIVVLLMTTAIFDSVIVSAGIVGYDEQRILGVMIGRAPIEDFVYALLAGIVIPSVWQTTGGRQNDR